MSETSQEVASPRLTEYAELHGCSCKIDQGDLESLLEEVELYEPHEDLLFGVGEDASARRITPDLALVSTIDFFTPIVDDPYDFGRIAACNAASDAFATGAVDNLSCLVTLGLPREVTECAPEILAGIIDAIEEMDGVVGGGHTILNPWPFAGGAVTATATPDDLLTTTGATPGDQLYLTKPLGTQAAMGALRVQEGEFSTTVSETAPRPIADIGDNAIEWMTTPNRTAARIARRYGTTATDITGFGLLGQTKLLAERSAVGVEISQFPIIAGTRELSRLFGYGLETGESAETSGGLLFSVPEQHTNDVEDALSDADVFYSRIGQVTDGDAVQLDNPTLEEISS